jgi:hypothetical protein
MFEPVTMTRAASAVAGAGVASSGGGFCANALDAMARNIPTVVARAARKNPEFVCSVFISLMGFEDGRNEDAKRVQDFF